MPTYKAPTRDTKFVVNELLRLESYSNLAGFENTSLDLTDVAPGDRVRTLVRGVARLGEVQHHVTDLAARSDDAPRAHAVDRPTVVVDLIDDGTGGGGSRLAAAGIAGTRRATGQGQREGGEGQCVLHGRVSFSGGRWEPTHRPGRRQLRPGHASRPPRRARGTGRVRCGPGALAALLP